MAERLGAAVGDERAARPGADGRERARDALGVARELHRGGVGEELALARHRRLDQPAEEEAGVADDQQGGADEHDAAAAAAVVAAAPRAEQEVADLADEQDAGEHADHLHAEPHVAVEDVAELVRHHALQLVARQRARGALGDGHHRLVGAVARGEGVDAALAAQDVDVGHRDAGGDGHLVDDVQEPALVGVAGAALHPHAAGQLGHRVAAAAHLEHADQRADADHGQRHHGQGDVQPGRRREEPARAHVQGERDHQVDGEDDADDGEREQHDEERGAPPRPRLVLEERHGHDVS